MGIIQIIGATLQLILKILDAWFERNAEKRKKKEEALNAVKEGISTRDPSKITKGFDRFNRV
jgi:hypothetical protein